MRHLLRILPILVLATTLVAGNPKGIIIYKAHPDNIDDVARVVEYSSYERFTRVINYTPADGGPLVRINAPGFVGVVEYPDLNVATIVSQEQVAQFEKVVAQLKQILSKYLLAREVVEDELTRLTAAEQMFAQGSVLVEGSWKKREEYEASMGVADSALQNFSIDGRVYKDLKLTSIVGASIKFMHSGGFGSVDIQKLTDEQIRQLNATSPDIAIKREALMAGLSAGETKGEDVEPNATPLNSGSSTPADGKAKASGESAGEDWVAARFRGIPHEFKGWRFGNTRQDLMTQIQGLSEKENEGSKHGITVLKGDYYGSRIYLYLKDDSLVSVDVTWEESENAHGEKKYSDFLRTIGADSTSSSITLTKGGDVKTTISDVQFADCYGIMSYSTGVWRTGNWFIVSLFDKGYIEREFAPIVERVVATILKQDGNSISEEEIKILKSGEEDKYIVLSPVYEGVAGYLPAISELFGSFSVGAFSRFFPPASSVEIRANPYAMDREFTWEDSKGNRTTIMGTTTTLNRASDGFWGKSDDAPKSASQGGMKNRDSLPKLTADSGNPQEGKPILGFPVPKLGEKMDIYRERAGNVEFESLSNHKGFIARSSPDRYGCRVAMSVFLRSSISSNYEGGDEISLIHFETHASEDKALADKLICDLRDELKACYPDRKDWEIRPEASDADNTVEESYLNNLSYMSFARLSQMKRVETSSFGAMTLPLNAELYFFDNDGFQYYKSCDGYIHQ